MRNITRLIAMTVLITLLDSRSASAHPSGLQAGDAWWLAWHFDPLVAINLLLLAVLYGRGLLGIWARSGIGQVVASWRAMAFVIGVLAVLAALMSPLDTLADDLSWVHMTQHMVLMVVAAPLIIVGSPGLVITWSLPMRWRKVVWRRLAPFALGSRARPRALVWNPLFVWTLHAIVLWIWHLPVLYELALNDPLVHDLEHLTFFLVACLFWRVAIDYRKVPTLNPGLGILYLFTTSLHAMVLGVLMALSPRVWYPVYIGRTELWGLSPLADQQLAGLIMWMPACMVYAIVAAALLASWLHEMEQGDSVPRRIANSPS